MTAAAVLKVKDKQKAWQRYLQTQNVDNYNIYARLRNQARWETRRALNL